MFTSALIGAMNYVAKAAGQKRDLVSEEVQCDAEGTDCERFIMRPRTPGQDCPGHHAGRR